MSAAKTIFTTRSVYRAHFLTMSFIRTVAMLILIVAVLIVVIFIVIFIVIMMIISYFVYYRLILVCVWLPGVCRRVGVGCVTGEGSTSAARCR